VLTVLAVPSAARADQPSFDYSARTGGIGIQALLDSFPEPSPVADLTDLQVPSVDARFDSFGTSDASAHLVNTNGLGTLPGLLCLAGVPCDQFASGIGQPFPPADPLVAHASYPSPEKADAPTVNGQNISLSGGDPSSAQVAVASAHSEADLDHVSGTATAAKTTLLGAIAVGASTTTQASHVKDGALVSDAQSVVHDVTIGTGLIHIGAVDAVSRVTTVPGGKPVDTSSVTISGVTVAGQTATIDQSGVHLSGTDALTSALNGALQTFVNQTLQAAGVELRALGVTTTDDDNGHTSLAQGLLIGFQAPVNGPQPPAIGWPAGVPCPLPNSLPLDLCSGVGVNLNADYFGQVLLGQAGTISLAQPSALGGLPTLPAVPLPTAPLPGTGPGSPAPTSPVTSTGEQGGNTTFGPPVNNPTGGAPGPAVAAAPGSSPAVAVGVRRVAYDDGTRGAAGRLWWLFLPLVLGVVFIVAGRLRSPTRLPSARP
jgi:hypothetical protein